jgi:hypothetical protein
MQHDGIRLQQAGKKIGPIVTPRAAMMTARSRHFSHRLTQMDTDSLATKKQYAQSFLPLRQRSWPSTSPY